MDIPSVKTVDVFELLSYVIGLHNVEMGLTKILDSVEVIFNISLACFNLVHYAYLLSLISGGCSTDYSADTTTDSTSCCLSSKN